MTNIRCTLLTFQNCSNSRTHLVVVDSASHYFVVAFISDWTRIDNYGMFDAMFNRTVETEKYNSFVLFYCSTEQTQCRAPPSEGMIVFSVYIWTK